MARVPDKFNGTQAQRLVDRLVKNFDDSKGTVLEITKAYEYLEYEKGLYSYAFVRPIKRIRNSLGINRELLVLMTTFNEQQPRTIEAARKIINSEDVRLESSVVIVVHADPSGNSKLRLWGREAGMSVVPLYFRGRSISSEELEKNLASEFYSFDPFDFSGPVSEEGMFFGRKSEALEVARQLKIGQIKSYLGIRKIGKTSLINRIVKDLRDDPNFTILMVDCSRDVLSSQNAAGLITALAEAVQTVGDRGYITPSNPKNKNPDVTLASENLFKVIEAHKKGLIIIFDEIDYITPSSPTNKEWSKNFNTFWRNLRSVYQDAKRSGKTISIIICGVSGYWFRVESIEEIENAALSFIPENYLSPLSETASVSMVRELGLLCGLRFEEGVPEYLARENGFMPFWIRKAGSYIHKHLEHIDRPTNVSLEQAKTIFGSYVEEDGLTTASVAIRHLFRVDSKTRSAAEKFVGNLKLSPTEEVLLYKYGITRRESGKYAFSGSMFEMAVSDYFFNSEGTTPEPNIRIETTASNFNDWAEDLAVISRRMNLIGRKIRGIVLNFIRLDSLVNKKQGADERIRAHLPSSRRDYLKNFDSEVLMEKLYWIELKDIIIKEWSIFERVFNDQAMLKQKFDVLNDRPHAHAKSLDIFSIALYRRELDWLEGLLDKV